MQGHEATCAFLTTNNKRDCWCEVKRYGKASGITAGVLIGQLLVAIYTGSLVLLSDTIHVSSDLTMVLASLAVAVAVRQMSDRSDERIRTIFGYLGIALLTVGAFYVWAEAHERLVHPRAIESGWVLVTGILGGVGNYAVHRILHAVPEGAHTTTHEVLDAHVLSDLMLSVVVATSALATMLFGWHTFDPIGSIVIAGYMLFLSGRLSQRLAGHTHNHHHH